MVDEGSYMFLRKSVLNNAVEKDKCCVKQHACACIGGAAHWLLATACALGWDRGMQINNGVGANGLSARCPLLVMYGRSSKMCLRQQYIGGAAQKAHASIANAWFFEGGINGAPLGRCAGAAQTATAKV